MRVATIEITERFTIPVVGNDKRPDTETDLRKSQDNGILIGDELCRIRIAAQVKRSNRIEPVSQFVVGRQLFDDAFALGHLLFQRMAQLRLHGIEALAHGQIVVGKYRPGHQHAGHEHHQTHAQSEQYQHFTFKAESLEESLHGAQDEIHEMARVGNRVGGRVGKSICSKARPLRADSALSTPLP